MQITVVIPSYRRASALRRGLVALMAQLRPPDSVVITVRPDDWETRDVIESLQGYLPLRTADVCRPGLVAALNAGLDSATGDVVAFTDDDAEPHRDWLRRIQDVLESDRQIAGVGGRDWVYQDGRLVEGRADVVGTVSWYGRVVGNHHLGTGPARDVHVLKGVNMAFRRQPLSEVRFDERLLGVGVEYHTEVGVCLKLLARGWRIVYDPSIGVDHRPAARIEGRRELDREDLIRCAAHNETLALLEYLSPKRRVAHLIWALLIGTNATPGPIQLPRSVIVHRSLNWHATRGAVRGRVDAWRAYRAARAPRQDSVLAIAHSSSGALRARQLLQGRSGEAVVVAGPGRRGAMRAVGAVLRRPARTVYLVDVGMSTASATLLARALGRRVVIDTGDLSYALARSAGGRSAFGLATVALGERVTLRLADHVVVRGHAHLEHLGRRSASVVPDVAPEEARPVAGDAARARLRIPPHAFVVGLVGSLVWAPRLGRCYGWDLVEALVNTNPDVHAVIVGDGDGRAWLERRANELGVADRCHFVGRVPPERVAEWIGAMDAATSTQTNDAVGAVRTTGKLPLYLACGCPVLASHVGEAARLLGPLGWTIPYRGTVDHEYPNRLARAVEDWAADPTRQNERREAARRVAAEAFDLVEMRARLAAVLDTVSES